MSSMFSWLPSWLPSLPSTDYLSLPSGIQGRFISFILKRSLGHFLKPGQLDPQQIDSQVGSGYIQVNDLELDTRAVNNLLLGLPIVLDTGSVGSVTARIPWPNPLTATIGFSLNSLHFTFRTQEEHRRTTHVNLADSVVSMAQSFVHEELDSTEEDALKQSLRPESHLDLNDHNVPGGINPFLDTPEDVAQTEGDPEGISLFAVLIERLLSRFQFDAKDTKITLIDHEGHAVTLTIDEIQYHTDIPEDNERSSPSAESEGEVRKLAIHGLNVRVSRTLAPRSPSTTTGRASPTSSESSMDAGAQWAMSQSLAFLPPRSGSPDSAVSASMYQSAISTHAPDAEVEEPIASSSHDDGDDNNIISFGPDPIVVRLITPPLRTMNTSYPFDIRLSVKAGIVRVAIRPWHIQSVLSLVRSITSQSTLSPSSPSSTSNSSSGSAMQVDVDIGGLVALLLPHPRHGDATETTDKFFLHPLAPLALPEAYFRLNVDSISATASVNPSTDEKTLAFSSTLDVNDVNLFGFTSTAEGTIAFPILITDPLLSAQYSSQHSHPSGLAPDEDITLPVFDVADWTSEAIRNHGHGTKLSSWRTKPKQSKPLHMSNRRTSDTLQVNNVLVRVSAKRNSPTPDDSYPLTEVEADILSPLHFFLDVRWLAVESGLISLVEELSSGLNKDPEPSLDTPKQSRELRSRTLKELNLDLNYELGDEEGTPMTPKRSRKGTQTRKRNATSNPTASLRFSLSLPMIRAQVRCPPAAGNARSGALVVDIKEVKVIIGGERERTGRPKVTSFDDSARGLEGNTQLLVHIGRMLVALAPSGSSRATTVLSIGRLNNTDDSITTPRIAITQSEPKRQDTPVTLTLSLDFPSAVVNVSKEAFDALQYWADDISQTLQEAFESAASVDSGSRDTSIIGSRYFAQSRGGSSNASMFSETREPKDEFVVKTSIHEAFVRVQLRRAQENHVVRPVDILASDIDVLVEIKPEGKDQTFITVAAMELSAINHTCSQESVTLLSLASPRDKLQASKPLLKLRFTSLTIPGTTSKESRIRISLWGFTYSFSADTAWMTDLASFASAPPGAFETVVPSERTSLLVKVMDGSISVTAPNHPGAVIMHLGELEFATTLVGNAPTLTFKLSVPSLALLAIDDVAECVASEASSNDGFAFWAKRGYALLAEISSLRLSFESNKATSDIKVLADQLNLCLHLCADTMTSVTACMNDLVSSFSPPPKDKPSKGKKRPRILSESGSEPKGIVNMLSSLDDLAFKRIPQIGSAPDMIFDDLPTNPDYLDESFGAAAGLRELRDDDLEDFDDNYVGPLNSSDEARPGIISTFGGETIRLLRPEGLKIVEDHFDNLPPESTDDSASLGETDVQVRIRNSDVSVRLYDGYDWAHTRRTIENEVKEMRKRLAKIRQLVANGQQTQEADIEETSALLFNSVYIGLQQDADEMDPNALVAAIDEELKDDLETESLQESWQTLPAPSSRTPSGVSARPVSKRLNRSKGPSIEFQVIGLDATFDKYKPKEQLVSKVFATVGNLEILDHMKSSTWRKFLSAMRSDSRGNIRETGSSMVRFELRTLRPVADDPSEESRLRLKVLPIRLHVDQDALDFLKKFFSFSDPRIPSAPADPDEGIYFQLAEVFPVDLKLDYKPRRVDYRALREGKTIELMNFFHFDGAEMTLRHITLSGITGWPRLGELLNDLWTPDVKATQLVDVISGVSPIRSVVNVGSGIADLVLLPISQYKKDGRVVRGVQKGTKAFVQSTAAEAIKLGAHLATGTQVILEQAEGVLGNEFKHTITAETIQVPDQVVLDPDDFSEEDLDLISKYAEQPMNLKEGIHSAYHSLQKNLNSAAQTILAVPMEVYERSGNEGPVRSVIRAVPIAILRPMIGASEAVSKTLMGLHNSLDPNLRHEYDVKYKHRSST